MNAYRTDANSRMEEHHRRHLSTAATLEQPQRDVDDGDERLLPRGGIVSRTPSSATATAKKSSSTTPDYDDLLCDEMIEVDDEDALFTFHPVDEPDVEVDVSNIFQAPSSVLANKVGGSSVSGSSDESGSAESPSDRGSHNKESTATSRPRKRAHSQLSLHGAPPLGIPTCISDEEEGYDDDADEHNNGDEDASYTKCGLTPMYGSSESTTGSLLTSSWASPTTLCAEVSVAAAALTKSSSAAAPAAPELCERSAPVSDPVAEQVDASPGNDDQKEDNDDESDNEDDDEDDDNYESRKRKEEEQMDEEQLLKKRKIEEEERIARNNLWRQSIKRSMFLEPPGAVLAKRATM